MELSLARANWLSGSQVQTAIVSLCSCSLGPGSPFIYRSGLIPLRPSLGLMIRNSYLLPRWDHMVQVGDGSKTVLKAGPVPVWPTGVFNWPN